MYTEYITHIVDAIRLCLDAADVIAVCSSNRLLDRVSWERIAKRSANLNGYAVADREANGSNEFNELIYKVSTMHDLRIRVIINEYMTRIPPDDLLREFKDLACQLADSAERLMSPEDASAIIAMRPSI